MTLERERPMSREEVTHLFIADIRAGMTDQDLREKYGLSRKGLKLQKAVIRGEIERAKAAAVAPRITVNAHRALCCIRSGLDDETMMEEFNLTYRQLQRLFRKLIAAGMLAPMELASRLSITRSQVFEAFAEADRAIKELY